MVNQGRTSLNTNLKNERKYQEPETLSPIQEVTEEDQLRETSGPLFLLEHGIGHTCPVSVQELFSVVHSEHLMHCPD